VFPIGGFFESRKFMGCFLIVLLFVFPEAGHSEQGDTFYQDYLLQRMRIARIRELRGDPAAKVLLKSLLTEARGIGLKLPPWAQTGPNRKTYKYSNPRDIDVEKSRYDPIVMKAARAYDLPPALIKAVIHAENFFVNNAISHKGAQGLMQLMPDTAREIGVRNSFDPRANIFGGSRLLKRYLTEFGSLKKTLVAYNAGPGRVRENRRIPKETRGYIRAVIKYYHMYEKKGFRHVHTN
jgi:soluble lytic murein transglycosylase-like protein